MPFESLLGKISDSDRMELIASLVWTPDVHHPDSAVINQWPSLSFLPVLFLTLYTYFPSLSGDIEMNPRQQIILWVSISIFVQFRHLSHYIFNVIIKAQESCSQ